MTFDLEIKEDMTMLNSDGGRVAVMASIKDPGEGANLMAFLRTKEAVDFAIKHAADKGVANPRITGLNTSPHPLNSDGDVMKPEEVVRGDEAFGYVATFPIIRG